MKIKLVGSSVADVNKHQFAMSYLVNETVAIDAGCIGCISSLDEQSRIQHVFLSHSHIDHTASLPLFLDNVYKPRPDCPTVYGSQAVLESLRADIFNDRLWPDFIRLSSEESPFLMLVEIESGQTVELDDLNITVVALDHVVPTHGFIVGDENASVAIITDTSPVDEIWRTANRAPNLKAIFLEACFPNSMAWLAEKSKHLTPEQFGEVYRKLNAEIPVIAVHIKPPFFDQVVSELRALGLSNLKIGVPDTEFEF